MASSGIGLFLYVGLQEKIASSGTASSPSLIVAKVRATTCSNLGRYTLCNKTRHGLVPLKTLNPEADPRFGVGASIISKEGDGGSVGKDFEVSGANFVPGTDCVSGGGGGYNGKGKFLGGNGGGSGGGDNKGDEKEEEEFGPIMKFEDVIKETEARGARLPLDMLEAAKSVGIRQVLLLRFLDLQDSWWPLSFAMKSSSMLRNLMLADPSFLFKVGTEIVIDVFCATLAEVQRRGKDFWAEFELYLADLFVGVVVSAALVGMLAPYARIGKPSLYKGILGHMQRAYVALPSSVFEAKRPGSKFSVQQRIATYFSKGIMYGSVGFTSGLIGQGMANLAMNTKRSIRKSEEDVPVPPLLKTAALWGVFLAISSNTRYQIINGLEQLMESSPLQKGSSCGYGFHSWCAICKQYLWWDAVGGLGEVEWGTITVCDFGPIEIIMVSEILAAVINKYK